MSLCRSLALNLSFIQHGLTLPSDIEILIKQFADKGERADALEFWINRGKDYGIKAHKIVFLNTIDGSAEHKKADKELDRCLDIRMDRACLFRDIKWLIYMEHIPVAREWWRERCENKYTGSIFPLRDGHQY